MAKQFLANRSGQTPTLDEVPNETIKIYPTEADLDADLANLEENEIVATDEDNNPASGTQYPVDVVQDGNMNAVTSNAVYNTIYEKYSRFPDYSQLLQLGITDAGYKASEDCYVVFSYVTTATSANIALYIDGNDVLNVDSTVTGSTKIYMASFCGYVKKGQHVRFERDGGYVSLVGIKFYKLSN